MMDPVGKMMLLQLVSLGAELDARLAQRFRVVPAWEDLEQMGEWLSMARETRVVITSVRKGFSAKTLAQLPQLRAICSWGVGYDTLDVAAAQERGVVVANTPDVLNDCVADMAWALLLGTARRTSVADRYVKTGQWRTIGAFPLSTRVWGKRLGILGLGRIGEAIARRGNGFGMKVRYTNRRPVDGAPYLFEPSLLALAEWADFLVVACRGGQSTYHLVTEEVMRALGSNGILVNIARGSVVDQSALVHLLAKGVLGGAGLDVIEGEPNVPNELRAMDQVLITPHIGSATHDTRREMRELVAGNALTFLETGRLLTPISAAEFSL